MVTSSSDGSELQTRSSPPSMDPSQRPKMSAFTGMIPPSTSSLSSGTKMNFNDQIQVNETSYQGNPIREHTLRMYHIYDQHHVTGLYY